MVIHCIFNNENILYIKNAVFFIISYKSMIGSVRTDPPLAPTSSTGPQKVGPEP